MKENRITHPVTEQKLLAFGAAFGAMGSVLAALALGAVMNLAGCATNDARLAAAKADVAAVMRVAYEAGGREAASNRIDALVAEGRLTEDQAAMLRAAAQAVYERALARLESEAAAPTDAVPLAADAAE